MTYGARRKAGLNVSSRVSSPGTPDLPVGVVVSGRLAPHAVMAATWLRSWVADALDGPELPDLVEQLAPTLLA